MAEGCPRCLPLCGCTEGKNNGKEIANVCKYLFVSVCVPARVYTRAGAVFEPLCRSARWSAVSEFGQKVNNYSAYSVIMVPVSPAPEEGGGGWGGEVARQTELLRDEVRATQERSTPGYLLTQA